jgi:hypothetical protein
MLNETTSASTTHGERSGLRIGAGRFPVVSNLGCLELGASTYELEYLKPAH